MTPFRFLHTADLHLGTPFLGLSTELPPVWLSRVKSAADAAFQRMVDTALEHAVDFVTIAGDLFDADITPISVQFDFVRELERLTAVGIPVFLSHGNHDPLSQSRPIHWPNGVYAFSQVPVAPSEGYVVESTHFTLPSGTKVQISGFSYPTQSLYTAFAEYFVRDDDSDYAIGLYHGSVGTSQEHANYCAVGISDLAKRGFDFWGLGHIHKPQVLQERQPVIVYPGNPQGRHIGEEGNRGCYLVEVGREGQTTLEFVPTATVTWQRVNVNVEDCITLNDVREAMVGVLGQVSPTCPVIVRVTLSGVSSLHSELLQTDMRELVRSEMEHRRFSVWVDQVIVKTKPALDVETLLHSDSLLGIILRQSAAYEGNMTESRQLAASVLGDVFHSGNELSVDALSDEELSEIVEGAIQLILRHAAEGMSVL